MPTCRCRWLLSGAVAVACCCCRPIVDADDVVVAVVVDDETDDVVVIRYDCLSRIVSCFVTFILTKLTVAVYFCIDWRCLASPFVCCSCFICHSNSQIAAAPAAASAAAAAAISWIHGWKSSQLFDRFMFSD